MKIKSFLIAVFVISLSLPAVYQILTPGYFPVHDDTQAARVDQMYKALSAGQFPVRWVPDLGYGYGYPIFNFYNPLPYYFGAIFMFFGADALLATKLMMAFGIILAGISMFVFTRAIFKGSDLSKRSDPLISLLAAILFLYVPYHAVQIYVRGAVAEYWAYAILPLVFYAVWKNKIILGGISLAALIASHNLTAFMSIPFLALAILLRYFETLKNKRRAFLISYFLFLIFGLGLSAFFWLPAIFEANKTQVSQMVFENFDPPAQHLITFNQLWTSPWGYGGSSPGTDDGLSLQLGKVHLVGSLAAIAILLYCYITKKTIKQFLAKGQSAFGGNNFWPKANPPLAETIFLIIGLLFSVFMLLPASQPIWDLFPLLSYIQFPWRFLTFASLFASILTAYFVINLNAGLIYFFGRARIFVSQKSAGTPEPRTRALRLRGLETRAEVSVVLGLSSLFLISSLKFFQPQFKYPTSAEELTSRQRILWEVSRRSDEYLPKGFARPATLEEALRIDNPVNQELVNELKKPTPVRRLGNIISAITIISMIGYYERLYRRRRR